MTIELDIKRIGVTAAVLVLAYLALRACGAAIKGPWETELESRSKSGKTVVTVMSRAVVHDQEVRAEISNGDLRSELMAAELFHDYSEVFWSQGDSRVYLLICSGRIPHVTGFSAEYWRPLDAQYSAVALNGLIVDAHKLQSEFLAPEFQAAEWLCEEKVR